MPRAIAAIALVAGIGLGTTGCTFLTPIATLNQYNPSDGVNASVGNIDIRNAVGIINKDGHAISLLITLVNTGTAGGAKVNLQYESSGTKVTITKSVGAGEAAQFGAEGQDTIIILNPSVKAGELLPVYVQYGDEPGKQLLIPVLDGSQAEYEGLVPPEVLRG